MSNPNSSSNKRPSSPIPITRHFRDRSASVSSSSSSASSPSELPTPNTDRASPRITIPSPGSSPILSYFLAQSPSKNPATFPFRKFGTAPVFEEDENGNEPHAAHHARRASTTVADRFNQPGSNAVPENHLERGTGLLRRLSLSTAGAPAFGRSPDPPPNTAVSPTAKTLPFARDSTKRRATLTVDAKPRRAPSPMGERILKGHFDGFN